jgi:outer membrane protein OmpA-like peptidoglycan-associated protein
MKKMPHAIGLLMLFTAVDVSNSQETTDPNAIDETISFIACPVYRDVDQGIKSGCWLATDPASGIRFDISHGRSKPQWGREVLVEGKTSRGEDLCGGIVLQPVRIAVLPGHCNKHMLPAEGFEGRKFVLPDETMQQMWVARPVPQPPYGPREYVIFFGFNSSFPLYQYSEIILEKASIYAKASRPKRIKVTGYAATDRYKVSDRILVEDLAVAEARARKVGLALQRLGVPQSIINVSWHGRAGPVAGGDNGLSEPSRRRVTISIEF